jgi:hypothetical protein
MIPAAHGDFEMSVSPEDKAAMARFLSILNGQPVAAPAVNQSQQGMSAPVELAGAGQVTRADVQAMGDVLARLNNVISQVSTEMVTESATDPGMAEALMTTQTGTGVKIGCYEIRVNLDESRLVNKQNYSVVNKLTGETLAHELGLYEAAHGLVKLLNGGNYVNSAPVRELLEAESSYTSHKMDALRFKRRAKKSHAVGNSQNYNIYEARRIDAMDKSMIAKARVKKLYAGIR